MTANERRLRRMMNEYRRERVHLASVRQDVREYREVADGDGMFRDFYAALARSWNEHARKQTAALDSLADAVRRGLAPADREVVVAHYVDGVSWRELAKTMHLPAHRVREQGEMAFRSLASRIMFRDV